jgi:hypothetical protein
VCERYAIPAWPQANRVRPGFPQGFLASDEVTRLIFGGTRPLIDAPRTPR